MRKGFYIIIFFVCFFIWLTEEISAQFVRIADFVVIAGYVFESESLEPIPHVNIYVQRTRRGTITNQSGYFILKAALNDTIVFSSMGYKRKYAVVTDSVKERTDELIILMEKKYYELMSVDIIELRRYQQLKYEIINMQLPDDEYVYAIENFPSRPADIDYHSRAGLSDFGLVFSPITALYDAFSREGRERRKLQELLERDRVRAQLEEKISLRDIAKIANMNVEDAEAFLKWCNFPPEFILSLNDYDLIMIVMQRLEQFKRTPYYKENIGNKKK